MTVTTDISGRTALVTGASSGLGRATAERLAGAGATVYALGRNREALDETVRAITAAGGTAHAVPGDLAEAGFPTHAIEQVASDAGALDLLVNNAGVMLFDSAAYGSRDTWEIMFHVNVMAVIEMSQAAIKHMREHGRDSHIVSVSSLASRLTGGGIYGATKAALETYVDTLRLELEKTRIRVVKIIPGGFQTNLGRDLDPAQREAFQKVAVAKGASMDPDAQGRLSFMGVPDDVARAVHFAVAQPNYFNVFEMIVRPAVNMNPADFSE